jgi:hypothetical protein
MKNVATSLAMLLKFMNDREDLKIKKNDSNIDGF